MYILASLRTQVRCRRINAYGSDRAARHRIWNVHGRIVDRGQRSEMKRSSAERAGATENRMAATRQYSPIDIQLHFALASLASLFEWSQSRISRPRLAPDRLYSLAATHSSAGVDCPAASCRAEIASSMGRSFGIEGKEVSRATGVFRLLVRK